MDLVAALRQIHRVLKLGGLLVLTTPNVARLDSVLAVLNGANVHDLYSGYGRYGRHNREYNRHEVHRLLDFAGFSVEYSFTADGHLTDHTGTPRHELAAPLVDFRCQVLRNICSSGLEPHTRHGRPSPVSSTAAARKAKSWRSPNG